MNRPALIWHLLVKDLRYQRGLLALLWLLALLLPMIARFVDPGPVDADAYLMGATVFFDFVCVVIFVRMIQLDPPGRGIHFSATRPVDWMTLLASKLLFAGAFILLPGWIATLGAIYAVGIHFNFSDLVLFLTEDTIALAALVAVFSAPAFFLRKLTSVAMTIVGGSALIDIANIVFAYFGGRGTMPPPNPSASWYQLDHCQWLMFQLGLACTGMAEALFCYAKRPMRESLLVLGSGSLASVLLWFYWPINLSVIFSDQPKLVTDLAPALRSKIQFHIEIPPGHPGDIRSTIWNNILTDHVVLRGGLSGLEAPYFFTQTGGSGEATLRSKRKITSTYKDDYEVLVLNTGQMDDNLRLQLTGFAPTGEWPRSWQRESFEALHYYPYRYPHEDLTGVSIKGALTFTVGRALMLRTLPLHNGTVLNLDRRRYTLENLDPGPESISFQIRKQYMPLTLRGDLPGWPEWDNLSWIVINHRKGEYLIDSNAQFYGNRLEIHHLERPAQTKEPIPADWMNDAEIVFFSSESCGQISFPYEIPSIDLIH